MATDTNFFPYYNDFAAEKNFLEVLFNPSRPVQARELTQLQSILSNQVAINGKHIFKNGSPVIGGHLTIKKVAYLVLADTYNTFPVVLEEFADAEVEELTSADVATGYVGTVIKSGVIEGKKTIYLDAKANFKVGNKVKIVGEGVYGTINEVGSSYLLGVDDGVFFIQDRYVSVSKQSIIMDDFNEKPSGVAGLEWVETIVTSVGDVTLLDPARGTSNYGSAGADRLKIECTLVYYDEAASLPNNFIQLYEIKEGESKNVVQVPIYSDLAKELARRTYDESGDYTVNPFALTLSDGIINKIESISTTGVISTVTPHSVDVNDEVILTAPENAGSAIVTAVVDEKTFQVDKVFSVNLTDAGMSFVEEKEFSIILGKGKAYIKGYEIEKISSTEVAINRARDKQLVENYNVVPTFGNYVIVDNVVQFLNSSDVVTVTVNDATPAAIGTAKILFMRYHSGTKGQATCKYRLYILDMSFNSGKSFADARSFTSGSWSAAVAAESIVTGRAQLNSSASSSLFYPIPQSGVATLSPGGISSTSYTSHEYMAGAATGSTITFSLGAGANTYFYGPVGSNFTGTDIERSLYHFVNTTTGAVLDVSSIIISNAGRQLDVTFTSAGGSVAALVPVQFTLKAARTKTRSTTAVSIPAGTINSSNPKYVLSFVDGIKVNSITVNGADVSAKFKFDGGQRDVMYDYASLTLLPGQSISQDYTVEVSIDRYTHSGDGYFSVDSYPDDYKDIPTYISKTTGAEYSLADVIDFRPSVTNAGVPIPNIPISADYEFYLPRRDAVVIYSNGTFGVVEGKSDIVPLYPKAPDDGMVLYFLDVPPFTKRGTDVQTKYVDNKRYTMRDIGRLEKRIDRVEYYTSLSLLEFDTKNKTIFDENGFERFKNGFLVDSFTGHGVGNVNNADYKCSVDANENSCRPPFKSYNFKMNVQSRTNVVANGAASEVGEVITLPYTEEEFINNNIASRSESVNPFLVIDVVGGLQVNPPSDDWVDTTSAPAVMVNLEGDQDAWESVFSAIEGQAPGFGTQWNSWQTTWSGATTSSLSGASPFSMFGGSSTTTTTNQVRSGTQTTLGTERIEQSIGEYVVDVNLAYFMRAITLSVRGVGLRPSRDYHVFIDEENVNSIVTPSAGYAHLAEGKVRTDASGDVRFTIAIPAGKFRTGERLITIIDDIQNNKDNATSYASYVFSSSGLQQTTRESIISTRVPTVTQRAITESRTITNTVVIPPRRTFFGDSGGPGGGVGDPLAQTFFVSPERYPNGVFLSSATVFMRAKPSDASKPLEVQIRPTVNGFPDSNIILPFSNVFIPQSSVNLPSNTADITSIRAAGTKVSFDAPVYLEPGKEYALVLLSSSAEYEAYIAVMGQKVFGTEQIISSQVSLGSLFKSQNSTAWSPFQNEDLMMRLDVCAFSLTPGSVVMEAAYVADVFMNEWQHNLEVVNFSNVTKTEAEHRVKDTASLVLEAYRPYEIRVNQRPSTEKTVQAAGDFLSKVTLSTTSKYVSPVVDLSRNSVTAVHNQVNDLSAEETNPSGGDAKARYITRNITLAEEFETDYITVIVDVNKQFGTDIEVYYRALSPDDSDIIENKDWVLMKQKSNASVISGTESAFTEVTYIPTTDTIEYTSNGYTFDKANVIAVKVVFLSTNTSIVPKIKNFRVITTAL